MTYTNTVHGLLKEPLMSEPKEIDYWGYRAYEKAVERHLAYLKTAIQKAEGFDLKIPLGTGGLIEGVDFKVKPRYIVSATATHDFGLAAYPLIDMSKEKDEVIKQTVEQSSPPVATLRSSSCNSIEQNPYKNAIDYYDNNCAYDLDWQGHTHLFFGALLPKLPFSRRNEIIDAIAPLLNNVLNVQECDATTDAQSSTAHNQNKKP